jgi:hypothetical protein
LYKFWTHPVFSMSCMFSTLFFACISFKPIQHSSDLVLYIWLV